MQSCHNHHNTPLTNISRDYVLGVVARHEAPLAYQILAATGQVFPQRVEMGHYGKPKDCYRNAWELSLDGLHYVEGYAIAGDLAIPLEHAWCVDDAGRVYDNTWRKGHDYFGMAFNDFSLDAIHTITGYHCILGNLWRLRGLEFAAIRQLLLDAALPINVVHDKNDGND